MKMKIAVTALGPNLDALMDPRFGRCRYFVMVDPDDMSFEAFENFNASTDGDAGAQSGKFVASKGARLVLTGNCGPDTFQKLPAAGIGVVLGVTGTVREAVEAYRKGCLSFADGAGVKSGADMAVSSQPETR